VRTGSDEAINREKLPLEEFARFALAPACASAFDTSTLLLSDCTLPFSESFELLRLAFLPSFCTSLFTYHYPPCCQLARSLAHSLRSIYPAPQFIAAFSQRAVQLTLLKC
jgi:hypothetical protein